MKGAGETGPPSTIARARLRPWTESGMAIPMRSTVGATSASERDQGDHRPLSPAGHADDQRNVQRRVVVQERMGLLSVLTETLTVVRNQDDDGAVPDSAALELAPERAETLVGIGDLAVVKVVGVELIIGRWGAVGLVGIEVVDPGRRTVRRDGPRSRGPGPR